MAEQKAVTRVRVGIGAESYVFDRNEITLSDAFAIKASSGLDLNPFLAGITDGNPLAIQTLVWFLRNAAGIQGDRMQINFKVGEFTVEPIEGEADPTQASSTESVANISADSPTTAT